MGSVCWAILILHKPKYHCCCCRATVVRLCRENFGVLICCLTCILICLLSGLFRLILFIVDSAESTLAESHSFWMLSLPPLWSLVLLTTHRLYCWLWLSYVCVCVCLLLSKSNHVTAEHVCVCLLALSVMFARLMHSVRFRSESLLYPVSCLATPLAAAFVCLLMLCPSIKPCLAA